MVICRGLFPLLTTRSTITPLATCPGGLGFWLITVSPAASFEYCSSIRPTFSPALRIRASASRSGKVFNSGMEAISAPLLRTICIVRPSLTICPPAGCCEMKASVICTRKLSFCSRERAVSAGLPTTSGNITSLPTPRAPVAKNWPPTKLKSNKATRPQDQRGILRKLSPARRRKIFFLIFSGSSSGRSGWGKDSAPRSLEAIRSVSVSSAAALACRSSGFFAMDFLTSQDR